MVFWKTQRSVLHKGYLRPSYHGFLSYSKPRTGCVYLGPCRLLPRQQELLQYCYPCLCLFFVCINSPHVNVKRRVKAASAAIRWLTPGCTQVFAEVGECSEVKIFSMCSALGSTLQQVSWDCFAQKNLGSTEKIPLLL